MNVYINIKNNRIFSYKLDIFIMIIILDLTSFYFKMHIRDIHHNMV